MNTIGWFKEKLTRFCFFMKRTYIVSKATKMKWNDSMNVRHRLLFKEVLMKETGFYCPICEESLMHKSSASESGQTIRLFGVLEGFKFSVGSFFRLAKEVGVYGGQAENPELKMEKGATVHFYCPHEACRASLQAFYNHELSEVIWYDEDQTKHLVAFHNTLGKEMTFLIDPKQGELIATHGKNAAEWVERWGPFPEWR